MADLLREIDARFLQNSDIDYETIEEGGVICLVLKQFTLPSGYVPGQVDLLLRLPVQFPDAAPDMFWIEPFAVYSNGTAPANTESRESYVGRTWQRWSRHFTDSPWRPGTDDLRSYLRLIKTVLQREVQARAA